MLKSHDAELPTRLFSPRSTSLCHRPGTTTDGAQIFVQDQRERGVPYAENGHDMLPEAEAKKLPVVSDNEMGQHDVARKSQTLTLLHDGKLKTAEDLVKPQ